MAEQLILTPLEASSVLVSTIFHTGYFSEAVAKRLYDNSLGECIYTTAIEYWNTLFQNTQRSQLLIDSVTSVLEKRVSKTTPTRKLLTDIEERNLRLRYGFINGQIRTFEEIAKECSQTQGQTYYIVARGLRKLRSFESSLRKELKPFAPVEYFYFDKYMARWDNISKPT